MHVVFDARSVTAHYPGIGRYGSALTVALAHLPDVRLTLLVDPDAIDFFYRLPDVPQVPAPWSLTGLAQQWALPRLLQRLGADLYHSPYYLMPYRPGLPAVVTMHDLIPLLVPGSHSWRYRLIYRAAHLLAARASRRVVAVSRATAEDLRHLGLAPSKIGVVHEGVGAEFYPRPAGEMDAVRRKFGLPERFGLFVGTNKPHKNLGRLAAAWAQSAVDWPLAIAGGEDPRYPGVREIAGSTGAALIGLGSVHNEDLTALYSAASVYVMPSLYEGFGLPVLEAMASGAPVICSRSSSLPEIAGDAAVAIDPRDVDALAAAVARVASDAGLRAELAARGRARAAEFTWERAAERTRAVYDEAILRTDA